MTTQKKARYGRMINRWHDEVGPWHRLRDDNAPACGARYYTSGGEQTLPSEAHLCGNCKRLRHPTDADDEEQVCFQCGEQMQTNEDGTTQHVNDEGAVDHEADADHVAYAEHPHVPDR